jgi:uncharacterized protein YndB with AHSA1/START domain
VPEAPLPSSEKPADAAKPPAPHAAVLGDAKITINAPAFKVFAALTDADELASWWGEDVVVEADEGGRYETTIDDGRIEGTITAIDGPQTLTFTWPIPVGDLDVVTSVHYDLAPRGPQTAVHIAHRAPREVPGNWSLLWQRILEDLKAHCEGTAQPAP